MDVMCRRVLSLLQQLLQWFSKNTQAFRTKTESSALITGILPPQERYPTSSRNFQLFTDDAVLSGGQSDNSLKWTVRRFPCHPSDNSRHTTLYPSNHKNDQRPISPTFYKFLFYQGPITARGGVSHSVNSILQSFLKSWPAIPFPIQTLGKATAG